MRILIDECLDRRLCRALTPHRCVSVHQLGWQGLTNGMLLQNAQKEFDVFLTGDRNLTFQQNVARFSIAVIVLEAQSTRLIHTARLMPQVVHALTTIKQGEVVRIKPTGVL